MSVSDSEIAAAMGATLEEPEASSESVDSPTQNARDRTSTIVIEAANKVRERYANLHNESSGAEQMIYGEIWDAFDLFRQEMEARLRP